jgi:tRNA threonylcarbamoyladenosine biosynthesis protein TsaE
VSAAQQTFETRSEAETAGVGETIGRTVAAGDVLLLYGDLGAGKTAFVRGLARGLGASTDEVSSPTFTIMQEYRGGRVPLFHVDLYRLNDPREIEDLGLDEIAMEGVLAIEWAEKIDGDTRYAGATRVRIAHGEGDVRGISIAAAPNPDRYSDR